MKAYIKDGSHYLGQSVIVNGKRIFNPSEADIIAAGWEEVIPVEPVEPTEEEIAALKAAQTEQAEQIAAENERAAKRAEIASLRAQLNATDYKVIKNAEAKAAGKAYVYPASALHAERQALRDRIAELETELGNE